MGKYRDTNDLADEILSKRIKNPIIDRKNINSRANPRVNQRDILDWHDQSVVLQDLACGAQFFLDIPAHELPLRLNIVGHGSRRGTYTSLNKQIEKIGPRQLFHEIEHIFQKYNINSIRLCCCNLGKEHRTTYFERKMPFAQELANLTGKPVKAATGSAFFINPAAAKYLDNRYSLIKSKSCARRIQLDNNRYHDIDISDGRFIWFYPEY